MTIPRSWTWPASAAGRQLGRRAQIVEEGCDVAAEQARFLGGWEVAAAGHGRPPADVVEALGPFSGRGAVVDELVKDGYRGGTVTASAGLSSSASLRLST